MHETINQQMVKIKEEENKKYDAELQLLSEQINPHFMYNTLEEIQTEILMNQNKIAVNMLQSLTSYLRIGLSNGAQEITIQQEINHVISYVDIMNQRFNQHVLLSFYVSPDILNCHILKIILQPIVENSFKHGFKIEDERPAIYAPRIEITYDLLDEKSLYIEVLDNGAGFNIEDMKKLTENNNENETLDSFSKSGFGLKNVLQRLRLHYGNDNIHADFHSIPYYESKIRIRIDNFTSLPLS
jgi:two-component system sensor histidine kinase YesM